MNLGRSPSSSFSAFLLATITALAGVACSTEGGSGFTEVGSPQAFTVSYRNKVRVPRDQQVLDAQAFAEQLKKRDPVGSVRCLAEESGAYKELSAFLGGIAWSHPMAIIKDSAYPRLYDGKRSGDERSADMASAGSPNEAAPVIERPDLVGVQNGVGIFLSKQHGLIAVDARNGAPRVSCSLKLPGEPKNFLFRANERGSEIVIIVNGRSGADGAALVRYAVEDTRFRFVDAVRMPDQTVQDARLFDSTIALYTAWRKPTPKPQTPAPNPGGTGGAPAGGARGDSASFAEPDSGGGGSRLGSKVLVVRWDDKLDLDWEDALLDDPEKRDPMEGVAPGTTYTVGQLVSENKRFATFVAASDRYLAIPRTVTKTKFQSYVTQHFQVCTNYNPRAYEVTQCSVNYEQRPNPDYRAPNPTTGDYACGGKKLADCIREAAPVVSQYIHVPVGQTCRPVWMGRCEAYENRSTTYPTFSNEVETELTIYRFENESFTKLDSSLMKMASKTDAIQFDKLPLSVPGTVESKNHIQFQNGHLYVFSSDALQTLAVAGNSTSFVHKLSVDASTGGSAAIVFSNDRAMISARDPRDPSNSSNVAMLDLTTPSAPAPLTSFSMPGTSSQLILGAGGILGPGQVGLEHGNVDRRLQKVTLFSRDNGQELDNLLLGTEYDTFTSSWLAASDDQRIRLGAAGQRVFLPYSGRHHAEGTEPPAHRLNITRTENGRLVSERSFTLADEVIRTAPLDDNRSLVFGNSAAWLVDRATGNWEISTLREFFVPFASYRLDDADAHARISRVGSKCRITTHAGDGRIFEEASLAEATVGCMENETPIGFGRHLLFAQTKTGVRISPDGKAIESIPAAEVDALIAKTPKGTCWIADGKGRGSPVEYLDEVPAKIYCEEPKPETARATP